VLKNPNLEHESLNEPIHTCYMYTPDCNTPIIVFVIASIFVSISSGIIFHRCKFKHNISPNTCLYRYNFRRCALRSRNVAHNSRRDGTVSGSTDAVQTVLRSYGTVRSLVWGQYGEASLDVHELFELVVDEATHHTWRLLGARCVGDARSYYATRLRRSWGILAVCA
jgi:hypothetical protein